jgi:formate--tetrahydrofolate ligase
MANARVHLENLRKFGVPAMMALNRFDEDPEDEIAAVQAFAEEEQGVPFAISEVAQRGGAGGEDMARSLVKLINERPSEFRFLYPLEASLREKIETIAREIYRADGVDYDEAAQESLDALEKTDLARAPVCMAKTPLSLSDKPKLRGAPTGWRLRVRNVYPSRGAGFAVALTGPVVLMPGMPPRAAVENIDLDSSGQITGLR